MKQVVVWCAALALLAAGSACQSTSSAKGGAAEQSPRQRERAAKKASPEIPAGSPLAKIATGMKRNQVYEILGQPTSTRKFPSGKMFNPFYFGPDNIRTGAFYKGLGRIVFSGADIVVEVEYDPTEDGR